jgi:hypothetical protein
VHCHVNLNALIPAEVVRVYTDNKNGPHILRVGSRKIILHEKVMSVHKLCLQNSLKINAVWILRESNDKTDNLSRKSDCDDDQLPYVSTGSSSQPVVKLPPKPVSDASQNM